MWHSKKSGIQNFNLSRKLEFVTPHSEGLPIFKFAKPGIQQNFPRFSCNYFLGVGVL